MEKSMSKGYVAFIAIVAAVGGILFGYDTAVISGTTEIVKMQFGLSTGLEGWYVGCALIGSIAGVLVAGMLSDFLGRKKTMLISAVLFSVSAIGCAVCSGFSQLVIFRIIGGLGIGVVSIVSPIYISEVSPAKIRGTMVSFYQLFITIGFLLAYLVNFLILRGAVLDSTAPELGERMFNNEYWRGMLGCEAIPDLVFLLLIFFIPESPRWLAVRGQREDKSEEWKALREPGILKAVLIGSAIAILGQFMGVNAVLYYGPKIFADAGFQDPLFSTVLVGVVNMLTTVIALLIIDKVGRKKLVWWGVGGMIFCLIMIGLYFSLGTLPTWFMLTFFLLYVFCTAISISAVVFVLLSEMYPNRVRGLAMSIAGLALWVGTYLIGQLTPWMLENLTPAGTFFLFAFMCIPYLWIMYKHVPNTTGKSLEEIEQYWKNK
ncbi:MAG: sugar porter family MFS transporter [Bacteroidales bacterium]|nr:sugar porter family MFS transporter [Bacteroidales bacterium]